MQRMQEIVTRDTSIFEWEPCNTHTVQQSGTPLPCAFNQQAYYAPTVHSTDFEHNKSPNGCMTRKAAILQMHS